ncbi:hypothetical protein H4582DRAFT_2047912 [Lactarius indigo]|nr:hypothetical protein H4582DRAFT_2047912 [Lactarius indigo]
MGGKRTLLYLFFFFVVCAFGLRSSRRMRNTEGISMMVLDLFYLQGHPAGSDHYYPRTYSLEPMSDSRHHRRIHHTTMGRGNPARVTWSMRERGMLALTGKCIGDVVMVDALDEISRQH